jgi:hypothetical protein
MKGLRPMQGLLYLVGIYRAKATRLARESRTPAKDARDAYEAGAEADRLANEARKLDEMAVEDAGWIERIEDVLLEMRRSKGESAMRGEVMRDLEGASMRLRRELGDAPADDVLKSA